MSAKHGILCGIRPWSASGGCGELSHHPGRVEIKLAAKITTHAVFKSGDREACSLRSNRSRRRSSLAFEALLEWHLGEIASSKANMRYAISPAKQLNDMHGLAVALKSVCLEKGVDPTVVSPGAIWWRDSRGYCLDCLMNSTRLKLTKTAKGQFVSKPGSGAV
jgi:hypothetical protein